MPPPGVLESIGCFIIGLSCFGACFRVMGCCCSTEEQNRLRDSDIYAEEAERTSIIQTPPPPVSLFTTPVQVGPDLVAAKKECCICFERYKSAEHIELLSCGHYYHLGCFEQWREKRIEDGHSVSCPECRVGGTPPSSVND